MNVKAEIFELDVLEGGDTIQEYLQKMTSQRTVPNVFVKGKHIGGNDKTQAAYTSGELSKLLK